MDELTKRIKEVISVWSSLPQAARCACLRHGFANSDIGFGLRYPEDLDEYDRAKSGAIPEGYVEITGGWGPPDGYTHRVPEALYLQVLCELLRKAGHDQEAALVEVFRKSHTSL